MILAEDLLQLLYDDESGRSVVDGTKTDLALAGAVLLDLALHNRVAVAGPGEQVRKGRLYVTDPDPTDNPILDDGLAKIAEKDGRRKPKAVLGTLKKGLRDRLLQQLSDRGILERTKHRILGVFPITRWPTVDTTHERQIRMRFDAVMAGAEPDARTAALVALVHAVDAIPKVTQPDDKRAAKRRAKEVAEGAWAADAVRDALSEIQAATTAAIVASATAAGGSGGG